MLRNYFTFLQRYISRNKATTLINVLGLSIGMMACMLIVQYVMYEFSYDDFHVRKNTIFRVQEDRYSRGVLSTQWAAGASGIGPALKSHFPEVESYVRLYHNNALLSTGDVYFKEEAVYYASEDFFQIFSIKLIAGEGASALKDPFKIVISQSLAKKYFGKEDPIGKTLKADGRHDYQVTGVFEDLPDNTHMKTDALMSFDTLPKLWQDPAMLESWAWDGFLTYVLLGEKADANTFEAKIPALVEKLWGGEMKEDFDDVRFHLQPLTGIHLDSNFSLEFKPNGDRQSTYFLFVVGALILVIAWINYINLYTAKSIERAKEVGIRKVMGSFRSQLIKQILFESIFINTIALVIAMVFVVLLTPFFSELTGRELGFFLFKQNSFWIWISVLIFGGALLSGIYPAFVLSSYKPVEVLKGRFKNTSSGVLFRKGTVVVQFISSIILIVGTFTIYKQIRFMQNQELGVNINQTLVLHSPSMVDSTYRQKFPAFKQKIKQYSEVISMSSSNEIPGQQPGWNAAGIRRLSQRNEDSKQYRVINMDQDFIDTYGLKVIQGRGFSRIPGERYNVILNETAVSQMGFKKPEDAINDQIFFWGDTLGIVGVLKDYHQESLKKAVEPLIFRFHPNPGGFYSIKLNTSSVKASLSNFEKEWKATFPGNPFIYFFLDDHYNQQYKSDLQFGKVFGLFSSLTIFIACLGLFGLSSLTAIQRTKEIGVRKMLGASVSNILAMVVKDYVLLMVVAIVPSILLAWWIMTEWLSDFAYRIPLAWWIFAIPCFAVFTIAMLAVSIQTIKAACTNPVNALRYE
jgi:putative ABC transport system permease protein